jgi:hypothetical protein
LTFRTDRVTPGKKSVVSVGQASAAPRPGKDVSEASVADLLFYFFILVVIAALALAAVFVVRSVLDGSSPTAVLFGPRPEKRLAVIDQASIDGRRRLLLIRRDDVEHLIMTGGPVDVVIETGIGAPKPAEPALAPAAVYTRPPRTFGQSATAGTATERAGEP